MNEVTILTPDGSIIAVDLGIVRIITALWAAGVDTQACCEGHDDHGDPLPWVYVPPWDAGDLPTPPEPLALEPIGIFGAVMLTAVDGTDREAARSAMLDFARSLGRARDEETP